ncbi:HemK2/MTQ2 family protein methyltransferase [Actinomadura rudentiformis]|uniref:Methyltransferase n=1 Tax=Actinomadura rudentiformis TaxID=359158 RepID=A0A6H9ZAU2_9ACTN|nr:HemK2/MTQ2 family protein methyltransferase [Actinomadura rudentiformis]KAB2352785.1 methyltransferase [Actinomadura rudentiformis]
MLLLRPPGVYRPQSDTDLLSETLRRTPVPAGARVLDICTGTGAVSVAAARLGGCRVTAVDVSTRAVLAARLNTMIRGLPVRVLRGDLFAPVHGQVFDVILANPPYVPGHSALPSLHSRTRAWNAGLDGRRLLNRICAQAPRHLARGGTLLIVQSALSGVTPTLEALRDAGMTASVVARSTEPFGPVMRARAGVLEERRLIRLGQRHEELVVIRGDRAED